MVGSMESSLIWKAKTTPGGRSISRLSPSTILTSDSASIGLQSTDVETSARPTSKSSDAGPDYAKLDRSATGLSVQTAMALSTVSARPTPCAQPDNKTPEAHLAMKRRMGERDGSNANRTAITDTAVMMKANAATWPTPSVANAEGGQTSRGGERSGELLLSGMIVANAEAADTATPAAWPSPLTTEDRKSARAMTPSTDNGRRTGGGQSSPPGLGQMMEAQEGVFDSQMIKAGLAPEASTWSTPRASDGEKGGQAQTFTGGGTPLPAQMHGAATPSPRVTASSRDWKDTGGPLAERDDGRSRVDQLPRQMAANLEEVSESGLSVTTGRPAGSPTPAFPCWQMGYPGEWLFAAPYSKGPTPSKARKSATSPA